MSLRRFRGCLAVLLSFAWTPLASSQVGGPILNVDALAGTDAPGSLLFRSIRYAISQATPGTTTAIAVRGRVTGTPGAAVLHNEAIEGWNAGGPIVLPPNIIVLWDSANSNLLGGVPCPVVLSGNGVTSFPRTAFQLAPTAAHTRMNAKIRGLHIVAFDVGVDWRPNGGFASVGVTLESLRFNQCLEGIHVEPGSASVTNPLVTGCSFENAPQPANIGGGRAPMASLTAHVRLVGNSTDVFRGDYTASLFTANATDAGAAISVGRGFQVEMSASATAEFTLSECDFQGNGNSGLGVLNGMLEGFWFRGIGVLTSANFLVRNCYFNACGINGMTLLAQGQGVVATFPDGSWNYDPPETNFLTPTIRNCTFTNNGFVATSLPAFTADMGHGICTRTYGFGQMQPLIRLCDGTGTSAGRPNLGITANALDGLFVHSDWWLPGVYDTYNTGVIAFTRNDTWFERSSSYANGRHGIRILLQEGGGNPGARGNRLYNNSTHGVDINAFGAPDAGVNFRDRVVATPVSWNNFIYNLGDSTTRVQDRGIFARYTEGTHPIWGTVNIQGGVGVLHNTAVNHSVSGYDVQASLAVSAAIESIESNVAFRNGPGASTNDYVMAFVNNYYNCGANLTGPNDVAADPLLVDPWTAITGNLHLTASSPCLDQNPSWPPPPYWQNPDDFDLQTRPRPNPNSFFDMGADEY